MWNEFMEWEDDPDSKIVFYDDEEFNRIERGEEYHVDNPSNDSLNKGIAVVAGLIVAGVGLIGGLISKSQENKPERKKSLYETRTHETSKRVRPDIKDQK